jgi:arylsulfatase
MPDERPNIVFILWTTFGWGDFSCYGGITATPRIDEFASEGIRFNNYTVEAQCTPSRSAILTGRQAVRSGTFKVPYPGEGKSGMTPWEYTTADLFVGRGLRDGVVREVASRRHRRPASDRSGFRRVVGYRNSADDCGWTSYAAFEAIAKAKGLEAPQLWEGKKGGTQTAVRELNMGVRPLLERTRMSPSLTCTRRRRYTRTSTRRPRRGWVSTRT